MKISTAILAFFAFAAFAATAADAPAPKTGNSGDRMLAVSLLEAEGVPEMMEKTLQATLDVQMKESPELAPFRKAFETYLRKTISYEAQKEELVTIYLSVYTPDEIRELIRFYQTPIGRKKAAAGARIAIAAAETTQRKMRENIPAFQEQMQQSIQNMQEAPTVPAKPLKEKK